MPKFFTKLSLTVPSLLLASTTLAAVPVYARSGNASSSASIVATTTSSSTESETETETEVHQRGKTAVAQLKQEHKSTKSAQAKAKACENRKHGLETKFTHITTNATNLETKIGTFQTRATTYKTEHNVTVENWDNLNQAADDAKAGVDASLLVLKDVTPSVDCTSSTVAEDVATFKAAAGNVRDDLKAYKTAVMKLFTALQNAKGDAAATTSTDKTATEGSNQ